MHTCNVLPAKRDSDVMFCLQSYQGLRIDISLVYLSIHICSSEVYTLVFYIAIVNKVLHHCYSWLARKYIISQRTLDL